jgi:hypothetical protein
VTVLGRRAISTGVVENCQWWRPAINRERARVPRRFWLRPVPLPDGLSNMGIKYLPTEKDRKLSQRFQQKQNPLPKFKNSTGKSPVKKSKSR